MSLGCGLRIAAGARPDAPTPRLESVDEDREEARDVGRLRHEVDQLSEELARVIDRPAAV